MNPLFKKIADFGISLVSKKVGASAVGVALIAGGAPEAGWAAIAYAAIQGIVDIAKHYVDVRYGDAAPA